MTMIFKNAPTDPSSGSDADRAISAIIQTCPGPENWIALQYLYCDATGVAGARYSVVNNKGGGVLAQGTLDTKGCACCPLPPSATDVSYNFYKDPPTLAYLRQPAANPELLKASVSIGWFDRMADGIADGSIWVWGTIQGDFNEDQTVGQVATNAVITMIPLVDQAGDVRDIVANLKFLLWDKRYDDKWVWIALVLTLIGLVPVLGSAAKGVLKTVAKALKTGGKVPLTLLIEVLNKFHKGNAVQWLHQLAAELPGHAVAIKGKFRDILKSLRGKLQVLADTLPGSLGKQAADAVSSVDEVAKVADGKIDEAVQTLQDGLNKSLDEGVDFKSPGVTKTENTRVQKQAEPPDLDKADTAGGKSANALGLAREQRVADLTGGTVSREKIKTSRGSTDVDVVGPHGELIAVGGPAKARDPGNMARSLMVMKEVADKRGVAAKAYFTSDTPADIVELARKKLGADNVHLFD